MQGIWPHSQAVERKGEPTWEAEVGVGGSSRTRSPGAKVSLLSEFGEVAEVCLSLLRVKGSRPEATGRVKTGVDLPTHSGGLGNSHPRMCRHV